MEQKYKELIEEAYKSEYFGFILERELRKKTSELLRRNKWILSLVLILVTIINSILGYQIWDIHSIKKTQKGEIDKLISITNDYKKEAANKKREIDFLNDYMVNTTNMYDKYNDFLSTRYADLNEQVNSSLRDQNELSDKIQSFKESTKENLDKMGKDINNQIDTFNKQQKDWEDNRKEIMKISSTVYAYVERGNDRAPGSKQYRPKYIDLPFSQKKLVITFNKVKSKREKSKYGDYNDRIKEAELYIKVLDANSVAIFSDAFIVAESKPKSIPETKHIIEAQFIYRPPNLPFYRVPDFVILAISLEE